MKPRLLDPYLDRFTTWLSNLWRRFKERRQAKAKIKSLKDRLQGLDGGVSP